MTSARGRDVSTLLLGALTFLAPFSIDVSLPGLPFIGAALGEPGGSMQWTLSAYVFATGAGQVFWGPIADRFGRRPVVLGGLALYAAAAFACALVHDVTLLIVLRCVQGLGSCAGTVCAFAVVQDLPLPPAVRAARQAAISAVSNIGPLAAPIAGVAILAGLGWRWLYAVPALLGLALLLASVARLPETAPRTPGHPLERYRRVIALAPTLPLATVIFSLFAGYFAMISGSSFVLVAQLHLTTTAFAIAFALEAASALVGSFAANRIASRVSPQRQLGASVALALVAGVVNAALGTAMPSAIGFIATMSVYAFAFGVALPAMFTIALAAAGADAGVASGILGASLSLGGAAGSALAGSLPFAPTAATGIVVAVAAAVAGAATLRAQAAQR